MTRLLCKLLRRFLDNRTNIRPIGRLHNGDFHFYRVRNRFRSRPELWTLDMLCTLNNHLVTKLHWRR